MNPLQIEDPITISMLFCLLLLFCFIHLDFHILFEEQKLTGCSTRVQCEARSVNLTHRSHSRQPASGYTELMKGQGGGGTLSEIPSEKNKIPIKTQVIFLSSDTTAQEKYQKQSISVNSTVKKAVSVKSWDFQLMQGGGFCLFRVRFLPLYCSSR